MASQVSIINVALSRLGANPITSLSETAAEATHASNLWDVARQSALRDHPWNFAVTEVELSAVVGSTSQNYTYVYQLPADCLRLLEYYDNRDFKVNGRTILSNDTTCVIKYVKDVTDTTLWDSAFVDVMAQRLAAELAYPLTKSQATADTQFNLYERKLAKARFIDSTEDIQDAIGSTDSWLISARFA
jgi:hypothetical protein